MHSMVMIVNNTVHSIHLKFVKRVGLKYSYHTQKYGIYVR